MLKNAMISMVLSAVLLAAGGCVTVGRPFPHAVATSLVIGKTTRMEIEKNLGVPYRTGLDSGNLTASYLYYKIGLFSQPITSDLTVVYSADNKVKSYTYNSNQSAEDDNAGE